MTLPLDMLRLLQDEGPDEAWRAIARFAWETFCDPVDADNPVRDIIRREKRIADVDLFLATAGWDLWEHYAAVVQPTARALRKWWDARTEGRAVLILDGLSLREVPWLLEGLHERGYVLHEDGVTGAELPPETTPFAQALGFSSRSALSADGAGAGHGLPGARTECLGVAWDDAAAQVDASPRCVLWHTWPDSRVHALSDHGRGLQELVPEVRRELTSEGFWKLVERLSQGRRLVITSDHGYAATGLFPDVTDAAQAQHLKDRFRAARSAPDDGGESPWIPPVDLAIGGPHGQHRMVLGRRKWRVAGGHPTLSHGGLTVLEVLVPFLDVSRPEA